ncbi:uncharacterized protein LOC131319018 isoform X2 [Rhododendron vialii]|uniref:uncharacterized protein LOC131319018 isoform X2 n=1 Tax=Rhododendron vialii TaxID=182163 RepID=UPI00265FB373|nr:uncharacterized protein LOC131319018 isoform X2 [Rhododendron vialii]
MSTQHPCLSMTPSLRLGYLSLGKSLSTCRYHFSHLCSTITPRSRFLTGKSSFPRRSPTLFLTMRQSEKKMAEAIFPRSSANVKTWVSDKMAKDFNSSAPVESLFPANAKGSLQLPREDERRGSELGSKRTSWISIKARYDDPPKRDWGDEAYYRVINRELVTRKSMIEAVEHMG